MSNNLDFIVRGLKYDFAERAKLDNAGRVDPEIEKKFSKLKRDIEKRRKEVDVVVNSAKIDRSEEERRLATYTRPDGSVVRNTVENKGKDAEIRLVKQLQEIKEAQRERRENSKSRSNRSDMERERK